ncbi:hypothetical protein GCM10007874_69020 [Labrys miyagiensis]|uniref:Uncharacterized protein n=1 Tax=Labrys miyagiensis TaxID=346912 RepID=A0ABQ6CU60_9HYPH|nr:hypothetical protein GCM10007874_69020 [Labrys miyagiensis]
MGAAICQDTSFQDGFNEERPQIIAATMDYKSAISRSISYQHIPRPISDTGQFCLMIDSVAAAHRIKGGRCFFLAKCNRRPEKRARDQRQD